MNNLMVRLLADALIKKKLIPAEKTAEAIQAIQEALQDYQVFPWGIDDIKDSCLAKEAKPKLTKEECREILAGIAHRLDASIGVTHDTINEHVYQYLATRQMHKEGRRE